MTAWTWLTLAVLALGSVALLWRTRAPRFWRGVGSVLALAVVLFPLERVVAQSLAAWLYDRAPAALADRVLASRHILPLTHYQARADAALAMLVRVAVVLVVLEAVVWTTRHPAVRARWRAAIRSRVFLALAWGVGMAVLAFLGKNAWLMVQFRQPHPVFYTDCRKVWGHRGHPEPPDIPENTIASYRRAFDLGAPGVEMDVRYDAARREYFIGRYDHGDPPPEGQRLTLDDVFTAVGDRGYFWLDTKTIHYMTPQEAQQAAEDMRVLLDRYDLRQRAIIESDTPENLAYFAREGLHTSYWIFNIDEDRFPKSFWGQWRAMSQVQRHYVEGGFSAISLDKRFYTPVVAWMLHGARVHLFTVNDKGELEALAADDQVRVILTDTAFYDIGSCR